MIGAWRIGPDDAASTVHRNTPVAATADEQFLDNASDCQSAKASNPPSRLALNDQADALLLFAQCTP